MFSIPNGHSFNRKVKPSDAALKLAAEQEQEPAAKADFSIRKVLIVDDEVDLAELAAILLGAHGLEVVTANSAREALDVLAADPGIDAIISDVVMPGLSGLQLADAVTEMYPRVKMMLVSGYTVPSQLTDRDRNYLFTTKPYTAQTLLKLLAS